MSFYADFQFENPLTVDLIFKTAQLRAERELTIEKGQDGWYWLRHKGEHDFDQHGVSIRLDGNIASLSTSMWSELWSVVKSALTDLGGISPIPIDPDEPNPVYDETWWGILGEADDWVIEWNARSFTIVDQFLELVYSDEVPWVEVGYPFQELADAVDEGPTELDGTFDLIVEHALKEARRRKYTREETALEHLKRFLKEARKTGATVTARLLYQPVYLGTVAELIEKEWVPDFDL